MLLDVSSRAEKPWAVELYIGRLLLTHLARSFETLDKATGKSIQLTRTLSSEAYEEGARWCAVHNTFYEHPSARDDLMTQPKPDDLPVEGWEDLMGIEWAKNCLAFWEEKRREEEPKTTIWPAPPANPIPLLTYTRPLVSPACAQKAVAIYPAPDYAEDTYRLLLGNGYQAAVSGAYLNGLCSYWPMFIENCWEDGK